MAGKSTLIKLIGLATGIAATIMAMIGKSFCGGLRVLARINTSNGNVVDLTAPVMGIVVANRCGCIILHTVGSIYCGMGIQKVAVFDSSGCCHCRY